MSHYSTEADGWLHLNEEGDSNSDEDSELSRVHEPRCMDEANPEDPTCVDTVNAQEDPVYIDEEGNENKEPVCIDIIETQAGEYTEAAGHVDVQEDEAPVGVDEVDVQENEAPVSVDDVHDRRLDLSKKNKIEIVDTSNDTTASPVTADDLIVDFIVQSPVSTRSLPQKDINKICPSRFINTNRQKDKYGTVADKKHTPPSDIGCCCILA